MTADIRTAAQREAEKLHKLHPDSGMQDIETAAFAAGAVWGAARVTPTLDELSMTVAQFFGPNDTPEDVARAVLKLMAGLAEGEG